MPEPDEQVAAERHQCPADDEDHEISCEHQRQHREDEEVHVAEEAGEARIVFHVADAVHVDEEADAGDHHQHQRAERIEGEVHPDGQIRSPAEIDPVPETDADRGVPGGSAHHVGQYEARDHEGREDRDGAGYIDEAPSQHRTEESVQRRPDQGEDQHQHDERGCGAGVHSFISLRSSTSSSRPSRKICVISARPTTTSAAATTITMKAKICPSSLLRNRPYATSATLAALSMSSMHMKTTMGLRRMSTPIAPTVKRNADNPSRYGNRFGFSMPRAPSFARAPGQVDSAD